MNLFTTIHLLGILPLLLAINIRTIVVRVNIYLQYVESVYTYSKAVFESTKAGKNTTFKFDVELIESHLDYINGMEKKALFKPFLILAGKGHKGNIEGINYYISGINDYI